MKFKTAVLAALTLSFLMVGIQACAEDTPKQEFRKISIQEAERLQKFFKNKFLSNAPPDVTAEVTGFEATAIKSLKAGKLSVKGSHSSDDLDFVTTTDGKYLAFGRLADAKTAEDTPIENIKRLSISVGADSIHILVTADGKHLIIEGNTIVSVAELEDAELTGMKKSSFPTRRDNFQMPIIVSDDGRYLLVSEVYDTTIDAHEETMKKISLNDVPTKGFKNAKVTVVEYSDFQCPFCKRGKDMLIDILKSYKGKIKIVYKQMPLPNHNWARQASIASICAYQQENEKFWGFHDMVFDNQQNIKLENAKETFNNYARGLGLDVKQFDSCLNSKESMTKVENEMAEAKSIGISSTPTFVVNGIMVSGADTERLKSAIETKLRDT